MGELIFCEHSLAAMPYYIEEVSWNVYSLEELSYFIGQNVSILNESFMSEELNDWIETEFGETKLAQTLREQQKRGALYRYVEAILNSCGYYKKEEIKQICTTLQELQKKSPLERGKISADRYMENGKIEQAILEYLSLLRMDTGAGSLRGKILHNLGVAYAGFFQFEEAAECFCLAYKESKEKASYDAYKMACQYIKDEKKKKQLQERLPLPETGIKDSEIEENSIEKTADFLDLTLDEVKEEYRKNSACQVYAGS